MSDAHDDRVQRAATASVALLFVCLGALLAILMAVGAKRSEPDVHPPTPSSGAK